MIRVMLIAEKCSLQYKEGEWRLAELTEKLLTAYCRDRIQTAVVYMAPAAQVQSPKDGETKEMPLSEKFRQNGVTFYPVQANLSFGAKSVLDWESSKKELLQAIEDFRPDVIQCFGSEWVCGAIAKDTEIPCRHPLAGVFQHLFHDPGHASWSSNRRPQDPKAGRIPSESGLSEAEHSAPSPQPSPKSQVQSPARDSSRDFLRHNPKTIAEALLQTY